MVYRLKRRSRAKCNGPPSRRSRMNLSQRTERFKRSSLSSSNGGTSSSGLESAQTPTLMEQKGSLSGAKLRNHNTMTANGRIVVQSANDIRHNICTADVAPTNSFTTFTGNSPFEKYPQTSELSSSGPDIRTIHTRLQKTSYLKSLISPPECLLSGKKPFATVKDKYSNNSCYLNVKQRASAAAAAVVGRQFEQRSEEAGKFGATLKKLSCTNYHQNYGINTNLRASINRMSVIHSAAESETTNARSEASAVEGNNRNQTQVVTRFVSKKPPAPINPGLAHNAGRSTEFIDRL